ncbi:MAG TPA: hypothetical protein VF198_13010 [Vicinamibacterales bacterium]
MDLCPLVRRAASVVALVLVCTTALPPVLHTDRDDLACEGSPQAGDDRPSLRSGGSPDELSHCVVCHWLQAARACHVVHQRLPHLQPVPLAPPMAADLAVVAPGLPRRSPRAPPTA